MTPNDYQQAALRTAPKDLPPDRLLLNGLMGLNGEAGEAIDILKKHLFQGHELDTAHMAKELGDVAWYLAVSANAIGYDLETIMQMNVDKLKPGIRMVSTLNTVCIAIRMIFKEGFL